MNEGKFLQVPESIHTTSTSYFPILNFRGRIFGLGGVFRCGKEMSAFTFDWKNIKAQELKSEDQEGDLVATIKTVDESIIGLEEVYGKLTILKSL